MRPPPQIIFIPIIDQDDDENGIPKIKGVKRVEIYPPAQPQLSINDLNVFLRTPHEIYMHVKSAFDQNQHVAPEIARRYMNNLFYGEFAEIDPALHAAGLAHLGLEKKLILYESLAQEYNPSNLKYLSAINTEMGLTDDFYIREARESGDFFAPENLDYLAKKDPNLLFGLSRVLNESTHIKDEMKAVIYQQIVDAYCDFCQIPKKKICFTHDDDRKLQGFYYPKNDTIIMNTNTDSFDNNPLIVIETLIHEARHGKQHYLARAYRAESLSPDDPNYIAARVFNANINTACGYISYQWNYSAYHNQPAEVDARNAGEAAIASLRANSEYLIQLVKVGKPVSGAKFLTLLLDPAASN